MTGRLGSSDTFGQRAGHGLRQERTGHSDTRGLARIKATTGFIAEDHMADLGRLDAGALDRFGGYPGAKRGLLLAAKRFHLKYRCRYVHPKGCRSSGWSYAVTVPSGILRKRGLHCRILLFPPSEKLRDARLDSRGTAASPCRSCSN